MARTFAISGVEAVPVDAEVDIHRGLPAFSIVGLPDAAVRESRERVRAAIANSGCDFPLQRITVSLAPSDLRKAGPGFDLAIAAAILVASGQLPERLLGDWALAGELGLDGGVRQVRGTLAMAETARRAGASGLVVPLSDATEAALVPGLEVAPIGSLAELRALAAGTVAPASGDLLQTGPPDGDGLPDIADLKGQPALRYALEVAAAGAHSLFVVGPPGAGKSMAARRLPSLLPALSHEEAIEVRRISSVAGVAQPAGVVAERPFRAPHHTISAAGLVGGGSPPRPGEITLAHRGVLFLDELPEFTRPAVEALRQPLEAGSIVIARAGGALCFPAAFQLVAAANPCPCGHGPASTRCRCSPEMVNRYQGRLSGALADRIDLTVSVDQPTAGSLAGDEPERSSDVRERVERARIEQLARYEASLTNASAPDEVLAATAAPTRAALTALDAAQRRHGLSGRGWVRTLRLARTCADLAASERVKEDHVAAALSLRGRLER